MSNISIRYFLHCCLIPSHKTFNQCDCVFDINHLNLEINTNNNKQKKIENGIGNRSYKKKNAYLKILKRIE